MKRLTLILTLVAITTGYIAFSQTDSHHNTRAEVKQYFDNIIFPSLEKQQTLYIKKLSDSEKAELNILKENISERRKEFSGKRSENNNKSGAKKMKRPIRYEMQSEINKITDAHPKLNESYKKFVEQNMIKWTTEIKAVHDKNNIEPMRNKEDHTGADVFFERASNPDWLLLWDPSNPRVAHSMTKRHADYNKNKKRGSRERNRNPQLRAEIKAFAVENIVPVIAEERTAFDKVLNVDEKEIIETARQKIEVRKIMFKNWYESEDFVAGKRAKDPNFDNMRKDMQNSMAEVREIAIAHSTEIREYTSNIRSHADEWEKEITTIAEANNQDAEDVMRMTRQRIRKFNTPVAFLLFNPDKSEEADFFEMNDELKVIVYPNPVVHSATIAVIGAAGKNVHVTLYTKEGETVSKLYSGINNDQRLEVALNSTELNNDVYIIKIVTDGAEITRKIVVKH